MEFSFGESRWEPNLASKAKYASNLLNLLRLAYIGSSECPLLVFSPLLHIPCLTAKSSGRLAVHDGV